MRSKMYPSLPSRIMSLIVIVPILFTLGHQNAQSIVSFDAANISVFRNSEETIHFANFAKHDFKYLNVEPVEVLEVNTINLCLLNCVKNFQCISFNVARFVTAASGRFQCEILKEDMFRGSQSFVDRLDFSHFSLKSKCLDNPCKNGGTCIPHYNNNTYYCICHPNKLHLGWSCEYPCYQPLGMEDGRIKDAQITASGPSERQPWLARLRKPEGGWVPANATAGEYLEIRFLNDTLISKIATQGRDDNVYQYWVSVYKLKYLRNDTNEEWGTYPPGKSWFSRILANRNADKVRTLTTRPPLRTKGIRIIVNEFNVKPGLRVEIYGCTNPPEELLATIGL